MNKKRQYFSGHKSRYVIQTKLYPNPGFQPHSADFVPAPV